jgi:6-phospho-3-hexuloisomerase
MATQQKTVYQASKQILEELDSLLASVDERQMAAFLDALLQAKRIFVIGMGRTGLVMRAFAMRLMHIGCSAHVIGETTTPSIGKGDLLVVGSGSGETRWPLDATEMAKKLGARVVTITSRPESSLARAADLVIKLPAASLKALSTDAHPSAQPVGSLFEQGLLLLLDAAVMLLMARLPEAPASLPERHANIE